MGLEIGYPSGYCAHKSQAASEIHPTVNQGVNRSVDRDTSFVLARIS